jgi:meiotic recombination protein SPO11
VIRFIIVVEKDATFQRLLDENFSSVLGPCVIITGKGVPDLNTRQLVHRLWCELAVPVFALVDADPWGVEIMLTYRFGSMAMAWCCEPVAVPAMR